jgi:formate dehydrogenase major subunit
MAEAHPVAFANVVKAMELGAKVMHVDPHYSRTSALANRTCGPQEVVSSIFSGAEAPKLRMPMIAPPVPT